MKALAALLLFATAGFAHEIPRLEDVAIDGSLEDWKARGFSVESMAPLEAEGDFASPVIARLGWDAQGLLVAFVVKDDHLSEAEAELYTKDSVELFLSRGEGLKDRFQVIVAPGLNPASDKPRVSYSDHRAAKAGALSIETASTRTKDGYILECRIPWSAASWPGRPGEALNLQIYLNDIDAAGKKRRLVWYPGEQAHEYPDRSYEVVLAEKAGPPDQSWLRWKALGRGRILVTVQAGGVSTEETLTVSQSSRAIAKAALIPEAGRARAEFAVPSDGGEIRIARGDREIGRIPAKKEPTPPQLAATEFTLTPLVFSGTVFPAFSLLKEAEVEQLLGPVTLSLRFFDAAYNEVEKPDHPGRYGIVYDIQPKSGPPIRRYQTVFCSPKAVNWRTTEFRLGQPEMPGEFGLNAASVAQLRDGFDWTSRRLWEKNLASNPNIAILLAAAYEAPADAEPLTFRTNAWRRHLDWWNGLRRKIGDWQQYDYVVHTPKDYGKDPSRRWPVILFLHGYSDGDNREALKKWGPPRQIAQGRDLPFIVVAPRSPRGSAFEGWYAPQLGEILDEVATQYRMDEDRIYVTGLSMGGGGSWRMASEFPDRIAAIAPFCGSWDTTDASRIAHIPTWIFHGDADTDEPVESSQRMADALRKAGGTPTLTIYPGVAHVCWEEAYSGQELYDWFLSHRRRGAK